MKIAWGKGYFNRVSLMRGSFKRERSVQNFTKARSLTDGTPHVRYCLKEGRCFDFPRESLACGNT